MKLVRSGQFKPGEGYEYSNTNYILLGMLIESVTGQPVAQVLRARLFEAEMRAVILALCNDAGRQMGDAHRRIRPVDVLATGTAGPIRIDPQICRIDVDFDGIVNFRIDEHTGE